MTTTHDAIANVAHTATYGGSASAIFFGLNANEFAAIAGVVIAVIGLIITMIFKWLERKDRLAHFKRLEDKG